MFTDDFTILVAGKALGHVNQQQEYCLKSISSWIRNNAMALHVTKMESMVIATKPKSTSLQGQGVEITHNKTTIKTVDSHKRLDLVLDQQLNWNSHIDQVCSKQLNCSKERINLLKAIKIYSPQCPRQSFYKILIKPIIDYACVIWGTASQYNLNWVLRLQKYAAELFLTSSAPRMSFRLSYSTD